MTTTFGAGGANSFCRHTAYGFPSVAPISEDIRRCHRRRSYGYRNDIKGQGIFAYVTLVGRITVGGAEKKSWSGVRKEIGPTAMRNSEFLLGLPKTCSGKIVRRILRKIAEDEFGPIGDS